MTSCAIFIFGWKRKQVSNISKAYAYSLLLGEWNLENTVMESICESFGI